MFDGAPATAAKVTLCTCPLEFDQVTLPPRATVTLVGSKECVRKPYMSPWLRMLTLAFPAEGELGPDGGFGPVGFPFPYPPPPPHAMKADSTSAEQIILMDSSSGVTVQRARRATAPCGVAVRTSPTVAYGWARLGSCTCEAALDGFDVAFAERSGRIPVTGNR